MGEHARQPTDGARIVLTEIESGQKKLTVEPDTRATEIVRGFDAPREQVFVLAIAREAGVDLTFADFERIAQQTPHVGNLRPGGEYMMADLHKQGNVPVVIRRLLKAGRFDEATMTVTGRTIREELQKLDPLADGNVDTAIVRPVDDPIHEHGSLVILTGNLAPEVPS